MKSIRLIMVSLVAAATVHAATNHDWVDGNDGNWSDSANWNTPPPFNGTESLRWKMTTGNTANATNDLVNATVHRITIQSGSTKSVSIHGNDFTMVDEGATQARFYLGDLSLNVYPRVTYNGGLGLLLDHRDNDGSLGQLGIWGGIGGSGDLVIDGAGSGVGNIRVRDGADLSLSGRTIIRDGRLSIYDDGVTNDPFSGSSTIYIGGGNGTDLGGVDGSDDAVLQVSKGLRDFDNPIVVTTGGGAREFFLGRAAMGGSGGDNISIASDITLNTNLTVTINSSHGGRSASLFGDVTGVGGLNLQLQSPADAVDFVLLGGNGATNTYSGPTIIGDKIELRISGGANDTAIGDASDVTIEGAGQLAIRNGARETINSLSGTNASASLLQSGNAWLTVSGAESTTFAGRLVNADGTSNRLMNDGIGTLTLTSTNENNFVGFLTVDSGTIKLDGAYVRVRIDATGAAGTLELTNGATLNMDLAGNNRNFAVSNLLVGSASTIEMDADNATHNLTFAKTTDVTLNDDLTIVNLAEAFTNQDSTCVFLSDVVGSGDLIYVSPFDSEAIGQDRLQFGGNASAHTGDYVVRMGQLRDVQSGMLGPGTIYLGEAGSTNGASWEMRGGDGGATTNDYNDGRYENDLVVAAGGIRRLSASVALDTDGDLTNDVTRAKVAGTVTLNGSLEVVTAAADLDGAINGVGGLTIDISSGNVQFTTNVAAGYSGDTLIKDGMLTLSDSDPFTGSSTIYIGEDGGEDGATLQTGRLLGSLANDIVVSAGTGSRLLHTRLMNNGTANTRIDSDIVLNTNLTVLLQANHALRNLTLAGDISGEGSMMYGKGNSSGDYVLMSGNNTYSGETVILDTTELRLAGGNNAIPDLSPLIFATTVTNWASIQNLHLRAGHDETIGSLAGTNPLCRVTLHGGAVLRVGTNDLSTTFAGYVDEADATANKVIKTGSSTWLLTSTNGKWTADLEVNAGTVAGACAGGGLTVNAGGTVAPGNDVGTLTAQSVTLNNGCTVAYTLGAEADRIDCQGSLDLGSGVIGFSEFDFTAGDGLMPGDTHVLVDGGSVSGTLDASDLAGKVGSHDAILAIDGNDLVLKLEDRPGLVILVR